MELWNFGGNELKIHLLEVFNNIVDKNQKPQEWETGMVINIHKKGTKSKRENYSMKCELCKDLELQLSHVLNELNLVPLIVDLLSNDHNRVQSELPSDTTMNKQWTQVSYNHQKTLNHQKSLKTTDRILPQYTPETTNRFEMLTNLSTDIDNHKTEKKSVKKPMSTYVHDKGNPVIRRMTDSEVVKYTGRIYLIKFQHY